MKTFRLISLIIAALFLLYAAAGLQSWTLGSITVHNFPAGALFVVVYLLLGT